jgi:hypothetical protein
MPRLFTGRGVVTLISMEVSDMAARKKKTKKTKKASKAAKARRAPARKAKKTAKKAAKRPARKAKKTTRKSVKAATRKAPARKAGASARSGATASGRATAKKASVKPRKAIGEGDYAASRRFLKDEASFVAKNKAGIPAMGREAEKALEGPEGAALRDAEATAAARSRDIF